MCSVMDMETTTEDMGRTTISIDEQTADKLHAMKERGDSYDDVITRLIDNHDNS